MGNLDHDGAKEEVSADPVLMIVISLIVVAFCGGYLFGTPMEPRKR